MDVDKHYNARNKRIKLVAEPEEETDAANKKWVSARLDEHQINFEELVNETRKDVIDQLSVLIEAAANHAQTLDENFRAYLEQSQTEAAKAAEKRIKTRESAGGGTVVAEDDLDNTAAESRR